MAMPSATIVTCDKQLMTNDRRSMMTNSDHRLATMMIDNQQSTIESINEQHRKSKF